MGFLSTLIPGLREIRAPLIAGYLWLLFAWLLTAPRAPHVGATQPYDRLADLAGSVGPAGLAIAASIAAYLVGTLITDTFHWALDEFGDEFGSGGSFYDADYQKLSQLLHTQDGWVPVSFIRILTSPTMQHLGTALEDWDQVRSIERMCDLELSPGRRALDDAVEAIKRSHTGSAEPNFSTGAKRRPAAACRSERTRGIPIRGKQTTGVPHPDLLHHGRSPERIVDTKHPLQRVGAGYRAKDRTSSSRG